MVYGPLTRSLQWSSKTSRGFSTQPGQGFLEEVMPLNAFVSSWRSPHPPLLPHQLGAFSHPPSIPQAQPLPFLLLNTTDPGGLFIRNFTES